MWIFLIFTLASAKSLEESYLLHHLTRQKQLTNQYATWFGKVDSRLLRMVHIDCYFIASFVQEHNIYMYPETEKRLHHLCPSVSAHIVNGENIYEGVIETLMNRLGGTECVEEEIEILSRFGIQC